MLCHLVHVYRLLRETAPPKAYNGSSMLLRNAPCTTLHGNAPHKVTAVRTSNINEKYTYLVHGETEKTNSGEVLKMYHA
jgi:hypothetical protein